MESNSTENLNSILVHDSASFHSLNDDINQSINTRHTYDFDPSDTFVETDPNAAVHINSVVQFLQQDLNDIESIVTVTVFNSRNDREQTEINKSNREKSIQSKLTTVSAISPSDCQTKRLKLVYPLEESYRARYKSDYFPQNGLIRKPRYIADNASNHFITLKVDKSFVLKNLYIRVALITKYIHGHGHYFSPYKFQKDHNDIKVPDENPIFIKVETSEEENFTIRLQLVLIKSKLDQLNYVQPLQLFSDTTVPIRNIIHEEKLIPRDLITKYQLDQSQIAFTLCTKLSNDSFEIHPETTVISTVITEISTPNKKSTKTTMIRQDGESNSHIRCPHCSYKFDPDRSSRSKISRSRSSSTTEKRSNKKKKKS